MARDEGGGFVRAANGLGRMPFWRSAGELRGSQAQGDGGETGAWEGCIAWGWSDEASVAWFMLSWKHTVVGSVGSRKDELHFGCSECVGVLMTGQQVNHF